MGKFFFVGPWSIPKDACFPCLFVTSIFDLLQYILLGHISPCLKISPALILAAIVPLNIRTPEHNIIMLITALCLLTLSLIQLTNFTSNTTRKLMVCIQFILWKMPCSFHLIALPCDKDRNFLHQHARPPPPAAPDVTEDNAYHPFEDQLAFDWAHYHFTELQSSTREINKGLDLWLASTLKAGQDTPLPWSSVEEMYQTINAIQEGDVPFKTIQFKYSGPIHPNPPAWMMATYELCTRNS